MRRVAWGLWVVFVVIGVVSVAIVASVEGDDDEALSLVLIGYVTAGALIASRDERNLVGWLLIAIGLAYSVSSFGEAYVMLVDAPGRGAVGLASQSAWYVWLTFTGIALPLVFPTGRLLSPSWRPVAWLGGTAIALSVAGATFKAGDLGLSARVENPLGVSGVPADVTDVAALLGNVLAAIAFVLAAVSLVLRIRRSHGRERAQLKWFALVAVLAASSLVLAMVGVLFKGGWRDVVGAIGWSAFLALAIVGVPVATGIAILRHGLYDIDVVIRRTLVYAALTATLAAGYLGGVLLAQLVIGARSELAVAASTLAMAALFRPARGRIQAIVDRRFYRRRYDAAKTLEAFGARLREELDLEALAADLRGVVRETMQPASVSLWLRSGE